MDTAITDAPTDASASRSGVMPFEQEPLESQHAGTVSPRHLLVDAALGALAGAAGVWAMDKVGWWMYRRESDEKLAREHQARPHGMDPAHAAVEKIANATGMDMPTSQPNPAGIAVHYGLGVTPGALYGAARHEFPALRTGNGALYGLGLFLMTDEVTAPLLGIASHPADYPIDAHIRGLVSHVVLGVVTETVLAAADRVRS